MVFPKDLDQSASVNEIFLRGAIGSSLTDFVPKLVGLQRALNAKNFIVFKTTTAGYMSKRKLNLELDNYGASSGAVISGFRAEIEVALLDHLEQSVLPVVWKDTSDNGIDHLPSATSLFCETISPSLAYSGVAFPIRLGTAGNGYVVFCGQNMIFDNELLLEQHIKACQIMVDLVSIEERRAVPAEALSEREIACLQLAGDGRISEEIAVNLGLSVHTVNAYLGSATIKLDSVNRIQAIAKAIKFGYIH